MSRRRAAEKREVLPDAKFGDIVLSKFMNTLMERGKKSVAEHIVYGALDEVESKLKQDPVPAFHEALETVKPAVEVRSRRYWILGRVFKPGIFPLRQPTTLLEAISESGGLFTSRFSGTTQELADLSNSVIIRDGDILPVKFDKLINEGDTSQNVYLRHNDFIYLPSASTSTVLLLGAVSVPQAISYKDSLTLVDCIAQAKGPTKEAHLTHAVIVRGTLEKPSAAIVNLKAILTGKETDVLLQPGDIVWLPTRPLGLLDSTVKLIFQDAARSYAASQGSSMVGSAQNPNLSLPLSQPTQSTTP